MRERRRPQDRRTCTLAELHRRRAATQVRDAVKRLLDQGAKGIVLDLRDNGGGLLNEAVSISSIFIPDGTIVSTNGRARPEHVYKATGGAIDAQDPGRRARQPRVPPRRRRSSPARCRTATAPRSSARARSARASSRRSSRCPTAARSTSPSASTSCPAGATSAAAASSRAPASRPTSSAEDNPKTKRDEALDAALRSGRAKPRRRAAHARRAAARRGGAGRRRAREARPLPDRRAVLRAAGRRMNVDRARPGAAPGDLVLVAPTRPRARGHGKIAAPDRAPGRRARRDRGADARPRPAPPLRPAGRARGARGRRAAAPAADVPRRDLRDLPTFTIDPPTARDFDDAISAERLDDGASRVWVHIADVAAHVRPGSAVDREAYRRAHQRLRARRGRADAARGAVEPAPARCVPGPGPPRGDGRARLRGRERSSAARSTAR